jgi:hypothetical protein
MKSEAPSRSALAFKHQLDLKRVLLKRRCAHVHRDIDLRLAPPRRLAGALGFSNDKILHILAHHANGRGRRLVAGRRSGGRISHGDQLVD